MLGQERVAAVILAAGRGTRMGSKVQKQYMRVGEKPLLYYAVRAFESSLTDELILVAGRGETDYCRREIVERYGFQKVTKIVEGGAERYHSVYEGLKAVGPCCSYVLIHDGARPCVTTAAIERAAAGAREYQACVAAVPVKDTIKIAGEDGYAQTTPDRSRLWTVQTPQAFSYELIFAAYTELLADPASQAGVTDDAMVVEKMTSRRVKLIPGDYANIKVTTPEDLEVVKAYLQIGR